MSNDKHAVKPPIDDLVVTLNRYLNGCDIELGIRMALLKELYQGLVAAEVRGMWKAAAVAESLFDFSSWDDENNATMDDRMQFNIGNEIANAIRTKAKELREKCS